MPKGVPAPPVAVKAVENVRVFRVDDFVGAPFLTADEGVTTVTVPEPPPAGAETAGADVAGVRLAEETGGAAISGESGQTISCSSRRIARWHRLPDGP